ncbi:hypothetical protein SDC9_199595 [bioreactor metagenome]|uniref:Uncharacterized protein n=1 Tax=bioreactor metagenome TaxID=1076179 RepID=A0A645IU71_9ZZZZ
MHMNVIGVVMDGRCPYGIGFLQLAAPDQVGYTDAGIVFQCLLTVLCAVINSVLFKKRIIKGYNGRIQRTIPALGKVKPVCHVGGLHFIQKIMCRCKDTGRVFLHALAGCTEINFMSLFRDIPMK